MRPRRGRGDDDFAVTQLDPRDAIAQFDYTSLRLDALGQLFRQGLITVLAPDVFRKLEKAIGVIFRSRPGDQREVSKKALSCCRCSVVVCKLSFDGIFSEAGTLQGLYPV
jgi:hypothetical protein